MRKELSDGWNTSQEAFRLLRNNKSLLVFPVLSLCSSLMIIASFITPLVMTGRWDRMLDQPGLWRSPLVWLAVFAFYTLNYFIVIFFNSALTACVLQHLRGEKVTVSGGVRVALQRLPVIMKWSLLSATVGEVLRIVENSSKSFVDLFAAFAGVAWTVATSFVVPILVVENLGPITALKRSSQIIRERWGATFSSSLGVSLVSVCFAIPGVILLIVGIYFISQWKFIPAVCLIGSGFTILLTAMLIQSALGVIARTQLYLIAIEEPS